MTSKATSDLEFELLDLDNLCSHVPLASKCHNLSILHNIGTSDLINATDAHFSANPILRYLAEREPLTC